VVGNLFLQAGVDAGESSPPPASPEGTAPATDEDFTALKTSSPFLRSLDLSESLILTGIARIKGDVFATLLDRETRETHVVSPSANTLGWRMVGIAGNQSDLGTVTAQISVAGGEVFSVRFDENQLKPGESRPGGGPGGGSGTGPGSSSPAGNYREGIRGDGFRGPPPPEIVDKLSKLSEGDRETMIRRIIEMREQNRDVGDDERRVMINRMLDRALQERR
ncbi:MAG: hypothetical protein ABL994_10945, partial [Verrucomicrobiales bacterium]